MQKFILKKINTDYSKYLIYGTGVESPYYLWDKIRKKILVQNGEYILFDQLLQIGNSNKRFVLIPIKDERLDFQNFKYLDFNTVDVSIRAEIAKFLRKNNNILKYSILLEYEKEKIYNGEIL